jgi:hypothetical protein
MNYMVGNNLAKRAARWIWNARFVFVSVSALIAFDIWKSSTPQGKAYQSFIDSVFPETPYWMVLFVTAAVGVGLLIWSIKPSTFVSRNTLRIGGVLLLATVLFVGIPNLRITE